jgi:hypothetical protein
VQLTHQITSTNRRALDPPSGASSRLPPGTPFPGRAEALLFGQLFSICSPHHIGAMVSLGLTGHDWSSFYRLFNTPRIDYEALTGCVLQQTLAHIPETEPYVAVVDGVQIPRHSHKMSGTSWLKNPRTPPFMLEPHGTQRFLHLAALLPQNERGYTRALPLRWEPAFRRRRCYRRGWSPASSGSVPVVASTAREPREAGVHPQPLADRSVGSVFSRCSFREQQPLPACSGSAPRIRALLPRCSRCS